MIRSANSGKTSRSSGKLAEEVGFVHAVLEGFATVNEDDWDFVGELTAQLVVAVHVDVLPGEATAAVQFGEGLFDDLAEVTSLARVEHDLAGFGHSAEFSNCGWVCSSGIGPAELCSTGQPLRLRSGQAQAAVPT